MYNKASMLLPLLALCIVQSMGRFWGGRHEHNHHDPMRRAHCHEDRHHHHFRNTYVRSIKGTIPFPQTQPYHGDSTTEGPQRPNPSQPTSHRRQSWEPSPQPWNSDSFSPYPPHPGPWNPGGPPPYPPSTDGSPGPLRPDGPFPPRPWGPPEADTNATDAFRAACATDLTAAACPAVPPPPPATPPAPGGGGAGQPVGPFALEAAVKCAAAHLAELSRGCLAALSPLLAGPGGLLPPPPPPSPSGPLPPPLPPQGVGDSGDGGAAFIEALQVTAPEASAEVVAEVVEVDGGAPTLAAVADRWLAAIGAAAEPAPESASAAAAEPAAAVEGAESRPEHWHASDGGQGESHGGDGAEWGWIA